MAEMHRKEHQEDVPSANSSPSRRSAKAPGPLSHRWKACLSSVIFRDFDHITLHVSDGLQDSISANLPGSEDTKNSSKPCPESEKDRANPVTNDISKPVTFFHFLVFKIIINTRSPCDFINMMAA